jgi:DNA-binding MarR family transcriptional regulator
VLVHIALDDHVDGVLAGVIRAVGPRRAEHDPAAVPTQLRVLDGALLTLVDRLPLEPERPLEEVDRSVGVVVVERRNDQRWTHPFFDAILAYVQATATSPQATDQELSRQLGAFVGFLMQTHGRDLIHLAHEFELSFSQLKALHYMHGEDDLSVKALGESLGLSLAAMSRAAEELVQRGLVDRAEDPADRRIKRLRLTQQGHDLVLKMRELRMAGFEQFVATLSTKERALLAKALDPILARDDLVAFCGGKK